MISKQAKKTRYSDSPVETAGEMLREPVREIAKLPASLFGNALEQVGVKPRKLLSGSIDLKRHTSSVVSEQKTANETVAKPVAKEPVKNYEGSNLFQAQKSQEKTIYRQNNQEVDKQIQSILSQLRAEIGKLSSQTSGLSADIKKVTVESAPSKGGQYYINFFEMLILEVRNVTKKVSSSRMWLNATYAKKQKHGFWNMAKKHGNQFLLSDERTAGYGAG